MKNGSVLLGFTLSELLIALAILGLIATFTIPKVLTSLGNNSKNSIFKETFSIISQVSYQGALEGVLNGNTFISYTRAHLNYERYCHNNASAQGCWPGKAGNSNSQFMSDNRPAIIFTNGAMLLDIEDLTATNNPSANQSGDVM